MGKRESELGCVSRLCAGTDSTARLLIVLFIELAFTVVAEAGRCSLFGLNSLGHCALSNLLSGLLDEVLTRYPTLV